MKKIIENNDYVQTVRNLLKNFYDHYGSYGKGIPNEKIEEFIKGLKEQIENEFVIRTF